MSSVFTKVPGEPLLYVSQRGIYFIRKRDQKHTVDTHISLKTKNLQEAKKIRKVYYNARIANKLGLAYHPNRPRVKTDECLELFKKANFPDADGNSRPESDNLDFIKRSVEVLAEFFGQTVVEELDQDHLDKYKDWRGENVKQGSGLRTADRELSILSNALDWAKRKKLIPQNPIAERVRYHKASKSRHAKDVAPASTEEVHNTARLLFEDTESAAMGWQYLWASSTGMRRSEVLRLKVDAKAGEPGYVKDDKYLCVRPSKQNEVNPLSYITLREDQINMRKEHLAWLKRKFPKAKWWFPGRYGTNVLSKDSLGHKLDDLLRAGKITRKLTPHGARSFYVLMRRSWGVHDSVVAQELHHKGDLKTLIQVYGMVPSGWTDNPPCFPWLPAKPAWLVLNKNRTEKTPLGLTSSPTKS
jgi:integrase